MGKNVLKAFAVHIIAGLFSWFALRPFIPLTDDKMSFGMHMYLLSLFILIIGWYMWSGRKLLNGMQRRYRWFPAVSVAIPGLLMWFGFMVLQGGGDMEWVLFFLYYHSMAPLGELLSIQTNTTQLVFNLLVSILPSVCMLLGMKRKHRKIMN